MTILNTTGTLGTAARTLPGRTDFGLALRWDLLKNRMPFDAVVAPLRLAIYVGS